MRVGSTGEWQAMTHVGEVDPTFVRTAAHEEAILAAKPNDFRKLPKPGICTHLWKLKLPALQPGLHDVEVRTKDQFGQIETGHRAVRVVP